MHLVVDHKKCLKSGQCSYMQPDLFKEGPDGYPLVLIPQPNAALRENAEEAIDLCPASAINWNEDSE